MKVAGIKGIRVIMGAAKDERGSVFRNTNSNEYFGLSLESARLSRDPALEKGPPQLDSLFAATLSNLGEA